MKTTSSGSQRSRREIDAEYDSGYEAEEPVVQVTAETIDEDESEERADEAALGAETAGDESWRPMDDAPKDRIIEGRFDNGLDPYPIRWRNTRRRVGHQWVDGGVWHAADTKGAVQMHPVAWREWNPASLTFVSPDQSEAA